MATRRKKYPGTPFKGIRTARVVRGTGKLRKRFCVNVDAPRPCSAVPGVALAPVRFYGCYVKKKAAVAVARQLSKKVTLPGAGKCCNVGR